jgi:hypothetical protein
MGRPRTPTRVLDARGAFKKDPQRKRDGEPEVKNPLGAAPDRLTESEQQAWQLIADRAPLGVLTEADGIAVEMAAKMLAAAWADFEGMTDGRLSRLMSTLGTFGMNPSDRAKLSIEKAPDANPFDQFDK